MSSRTAPPVRMNKAADLRKKSAAPRKVGQEATKPKPGPARKPAPVKATPPSYEDQDHEQGSVDGDSDAEAALSAQEEEEIEEDDAPLKHVPSIPPKKGIARSRASGSAKPKDGYVDGKRKPALAVAPHMRLLSLVAEHKPVPSKPAAFIEFAPDMTRLFEAHAAVSSLLMPLKAVHKNDPTYNPIFSRLALSYAALHIILVARKACSVLTYNERKCLKALEEGFDFSNLMIPGPYVAFLSTFGFHLPADRRFEAICPKVSITDKEDKPSCITASPLFPHFPALLQLAHIANDEDRIVSKGKAKKAGTTTGTSSDAYWYWTNDEFTLVNAKADFDDAWTLWTLDVQKKTGRDTNLTVLSTNCALLPRFHAKRLDLVNSARSLPAITLPTVPLASGTAPDLLTYLGLKGSVRWMSTIMESLEYESKFFDGSSTLGSIGFETGQNILCVSHFQLKNDAVAPNWFQSIQLDEAEGDDEASQHYVCTMMENVSDGDMAIANLTATISCYSDSTGANPYKNIRSVEVPTNMPKTSVHAYSSHVRRYIRNAPLLGSRLRTTIKTEMMKKLDDVL